MGKEQLSISSYFKPAQTLPKQNSKHSKPASSTQEQEDQVIIVSSDSEEERHRPQQRRATKTDEDGQPKLKKLKLEHEENANGFASTSAIINQNQNSSLSLGASKAPTASTSKSTKLDHWAYSSNPTPSLNDIAPQPTPAELKLRSKFAAKLLAGKGPNLLKRKTAYLQNDQLLAASSTEASGSELEDGSANGMEVDQEDGDEEERPPATAKKGKGKGKGKAVEDSGDENDEEGEGSPATTSRFARFAAPSTSGATSAKTKSKDVGNGVKFTPLEKQVIELQTANPGVVLMVEVGYKYRFFGSDAEIASKVLGIACFPSQHMLTASIPTHRLTIHLKRLLSAGHKVGVVAQQETAALKKVGTNKSGPFTRGVSAVYTSATFIDDLSGEEERGEAAGTKSIMCIVEETRGSLNAKGKGKEREVEEPASEKVRIAFVAVMPSTGEIIYDEFEDGHMRTELETRMMHLQPSELVLQKNFTKQTQSMISYLIGHESGVTSLACRTERINKKPTKDTAITYVSDFFVKAGIPEEAEIVIDDDEDGDSEARVTDGKLNKVLDLPQGVLIALAALIQHLQAFNLATVFLHKRDFTHFSNRAVMNLNSNTLENLEILRNQTDYKEKGSLIGLLDHCRTAFGRRLLRKWVSKPLVALPAVLERQAAVTEILNKGGTTIIVALRELFRNLPDLERGLIRIYFRKASPPELLRVLDAFSKIADTFTPGEGDKLDSVLLKGLVNELPKCKEIVDKHLEEIDRSQARSNNKTDLYVESDLFEDLQSAKDSLASVYDEMQEELKVCRKILKKPALAFVKVAQEEFLIEVTITESKKIVPDSWVRINATKTAHRYRSPGIMKKMAEIEQGREHLAAQADDAFKQYLQRVSTSYDIFRSVISGLAVVDCLYSLATTATAPGYCLPKLSPDPGVLDIVQGRHPMVEVHLSAPFVPNNVSFKSDSHRQMILTGLNMGGKSSLSRSIALIALMAQIGSYVPAESCTTSLFDGIYTRMGASDELARGRSTFMVELSETSEILKLATPRSLIILDELGRGTSTMDGQAIASAVLQFIVERKQSSTVFITHYPQLAKIAQSYPEDVKLFHMACLEKENSDGVPQVTFLYSLRPGLASRSHGLNVARMAELPDSILQLAQAKSRELEEAMERKVKDRKAEKLRRVLEALVKGGTGVVAVDLARSAREHGSL